MAEPLIINNWQQGVTQSAHVGFADVRNVDVKSEPGVLMAGFKTVLASPSRIASQTFTANAGTDLITFSNTIPSLRAVTVSSSGTLPAGLSSSTIYYTISSGTSTKLANSLANAEAGTEVDITDAGTGTHSIVTVNMGVPYWVVKSPNNGHYWLLDSNGRLWSSRSTDPTGWYLISGNATLGTGNGLVWWKNYVLVFDATGVSAFGPTTSAFASQAWTNSGNPFNTSLTSATWHSPLVGQDDIVYYCNDRYVGSLQENGTFAGTAGTSTFSQQALDLPSNYKTRCLAELGTYLLIGTSNGVNENTMRVADIFPWDRVSSSFDLPLHISEFGVKSMLTRGNETYILAGNKGNLYKTNGSSVSFVKQVPLTVTKLDENASLALTLSVYPQLLADHKQRVFIGIGGSNGSANAQGCGVWSYDPETDGLLYEHIISTGSSGGDTSGGTNGVLIGCIYSGNDQQLVIGWNDPGNANVTGADYTASVDRYSGSEPYAISQLFVVGTKRMPITYATVQADFAEPLESGDSVVVAYRTSTSGSFTTLATFNTADVVSDEADADGLTDITTIQIKVTVSNSNSGNKTPKVREVRLIPATEQ